MDRVQRWENLIVDETDAFTLLSQLGLPTDVPHQQDMAGRLLDVGLAAAPASRGICHTRLRLDPVIRAGAFVKATGDMSEKSCRESQLLAKTDDCLRVAAIDMKSHTRRERALRMVQTDLNGETKAHQTSSIEETERARRARKWAVSYQLTHPSSNKQRLRPIRLRP